MQLLKPGDTPVAGLLQRGLDCAITRANPYLNATQEAYKQILQNTYILGLYYLYLI